MDAALRTQLKTLWLDTHTRAQKGQGVAQEFLDTQKAGYACENLCRDAVYGMGDAMQDTYDTDNSGAGKALKAALGNIKTGQGDAATKGDTAKTDTATWVADAATLRSQYAAVLATVAPGPVADALAQSMTLLDSSTQVGKSTSLNSSEAYGRFGTALSRASGFADEVGADLSPAKGGKNVRAAARTAVSYVGEMKSLLSGVSSDVGKAGLNVNQAAQLCWQAADPLDRLLFPHRDGEAAESLPDWLDLTKVASAPRTE